MLLLMLFASLSFGGSWTKVDMTSMYGQDLGSSEVLGKPWVHLFHMV
jgi:hypothetical protein